MDSTDPVGPLEVEEMSESQELRQRRQSMREQLQHSLDEVEGGADDGDALGGDPFLDDDSSISQIFSGLGGFLRRLFSCFLAVLVLGGLVYLGVRFSPDISMPDWFQRDTDEVLVDESDSTRDDAIFEQDVTLLPGLLSGQPQRTLDYSTVLGAEAGDPSEDPEFLGESINIFEDAYRAYQVDLVLLLNRSDDRSEALDAYVNSLRHEQTLMQSRYETLVAHVARLERSQNDVQDLADEAEDDFSTRFTELDALGSEAALNSFISSKQEDVKLGAEIKAFARLISLYEELDPLLSARILDIDLNREALVKGVEVVNVENSDLNLILDEDEVVR